MKKTLLTLALTLMLTLLCAAALAEQPAVTNPLPGEIAELFDVPAWEGYVVPRTTKYPDRLAYIYLDYFDCGLVLQSNGSTNVLCLIERNSKGALRITARNYLAVRGDDVPGFDSTPVNGTKEVTLEVYGEDYSLSFRKINGQWRIKELRDYKNGFMASISADKIGIVQGEASGKFEGVPFDTTQMKYAYGVYDNRFAAFSWEDFPTTLAEARAKLTNPPVTPSDFYTPVTVTLRAGEKYDVFSAPGRDSYRAAGGKAEMSTNDWVQIFGEEDGWLLVQYDISRDQMRFGYIAASALPRNTEVQALHWYDLPLQTVNYAVGVTDDPLVSCNALRYLSQGDEVKVLADFDSWYYIETTDAYGSALRGFIPQGCIDLVEWEK